MRAALEGNIIMKKRGRESENKIPVFGILKRNGKVYTHIIPNSSSVTLLDIVQTKIKPDSIVYTESFRAYNKLSISGLQTLPHKSYCLICKR